MKVKYAAILVCLLAFASLVIAQSAVDGVWTGEVQGGRGPQQVTLTLKTEGGKLGGTIGGGRGGPVNIEEASLSGSTVKFKTKQMGRGGEVILNWTGTVKGEEIAFSRMPEGGQQATEFTLKKQK
jgi:hypothetical protein